MKVSYTKLEPDLKMFKSTKYFNYDTNVRTEVKFSYTKPKEGSEEEYLINYSRNQIFKNQFHLPMKYLKPDDNNVYVCQKSPLYDKSNNINNANKLIEPLNIGFNDFIRTIPINQQVPEGTIYTIHACVPYDSNTRYFFMSNMLKSETRKGKVDFDPYIHIGTLDIGSEYTGKFTVQSVDLNIYDSYSLFNFTVGEDYFTLIYYDFLGIDAKYILNEVLKICDEKAKDFINKCISALK